MFQNFTSPLDLFIMGPWWAPWIVLLVAIISSLYQLANVTWSRIETERKRLVHAFKSNGKLSKEASTNPTVLLTAHPDDEAMFWTPTLLSLAKGPNISPVYIVCMSSGNADGLGAVRTKEMFAAAKLLQVPADHVLVMDLPALPDSMSIDWKTDDVLSGFSQALKKLKIRDGYNLITFDNQGVSGHTNHRALHSAALALNSSSSTINCPLPGATYELRTLPLLRKYTSVAEMILWSSMMRDPKEPIAVSLPARQSKSPLVFVTPDLWICPEIMAAHASQWVLHRRLFTRLSTYAYINYLDPLETKKSI